MMNLENQSDSSQKQIVDDTVAHALLYQYERIPFFRSKEKDSKKVYLKPPPSYVKFSDATDQQKRATYKDLLVNDPDFKRYTDGLAERDVENHGNEYHLADCIKICDEMDDNREDDIKILIQIQMTYAHRTKYYWE